MSYAQYLETINGFYPVPYSHTRKVACYFNAEQLEAALGLAGEVGEVVDLIKKNVFYGQQIDQRKLLNELGDALHYLTRLAHLNHFSMSVVMEANVEKLRKRFPTGYSNEAAIAKLDQYEV